MEKKKEKQPKIVKQIWYLYSKRQLEPLVLLALTLVPDNKFASCKFILSLLVGGEALPKANYEIIPTLSRLARTGLVESHSLLQYRLQQGEYDKTEGRKKLENFVQDSVSGPVVTVGNRQTQSVFRLTEKGINKLMTYLKEGILNDTPLKK